MGHIQSESELLEGLVVGGEASRWGVIGRESSLFSGSILCAVDQW